MKKTSVYLLLPGMLMLIFIALQSSCKKENSPSPQYYVKYHVKSSTIYVGVTLTAVIKDESNNYVTYSINSGNWEVTIGPVEAGFTAYFQVYHPGDSHGQLKLFPSIYVSMDNGPFTLECTDDSNVYRDEVEITYTIE